MKFRILTAAIMTSSVMMFVQCKKDSGGDNLTPTVQKDYSPITAGSTFTYRDIVSTNVLTDTNNYTLTVTSNDTVAFGKTYRKLTGSDTTVRYRAKVGSNYYQLTTFGGIGIPPFEDNYLNDSLAVGATWNTTTPQFTLPGTTTQATAKLVYKIGATGSSLSVNGINYTDVIRVELASLTVTPTSLPIPLTITINATGTYYYAKGYGMIQGNLNVPNQTLTPFPGVSFTIPKYTLSQMLMSSDVK